MLPEGSQINSLMTNHESMGQTQIEKRLKDGTKSEVIKLNMNRRTVSMRAPARQ